MDKLSTNKTMTTKEVAEALGVTGNASVTRVAKKCLPNKKIENGKPTFWTEEELTVLLAYMQKHKSDDPRLTSSEVRRGTMKTKEVAEALGVGVSSVKNALEKLRQNNGGVFGDVKRNSQGGYMLNEAQVTAIKLELQNHSKVNASTPKTVLEKQLFIQQAMQLQAEMIAELQAENEILSANNNRLTERNTSLQVRLDEDSQWASVKRMEALNKGMKFSWRALKQYAIDNGYTLKDVFDANYGSVKAYPKEVWEAVYGEQIDFVPWDKE